MKRVIAVCLASWLAASVGAWAFTPPTQEQISAAAADPAMVGALIAGAAPGAAAQVAIQVIQAIEKLEIPLDQKRERVAVVVAQLTAMLGENAAVAMNVVASKVSPELLPAVGVVGAPVAPLSLPIAQPLAPPIKPPPVAQKYSGQ